MNEKIVLIFTPLSFYSHEDEDLFFEWINKVNCITGYKGIGTELHVYVSSKEIPFNDFKNLNGLFERYRLENPSQLKVFIDKTDKKPFTE